MYNLHSLNNFSCRRPLNKMIVFIPIAVVWQLACFPSAARFRSLCGQTAMILKANYAKLLSPSEL